MAQSIYGDGLTNKDKGIRYRSKNAILGYPSGLVNPKTYAKKHAYDIAWGRANRVKTRAASRRYNAKITAMFGNAGNHNRWLFSSQNTAKRLKLRKVLLNKLQEQI